MGLLCSLITIGFVLWAIWYGSKNRDAQRLGDSIEDSLNESSRSSGVSIMVSAGGSRQRIPMGGSTRVTQAQFVCQSAPVELHGRSIPSPMVYVTKRADGNLTNPSVIDLSLSVARCAPNTPPDLPYWPSYEGMSASHRASYLDWLAGGRCGDVPMGYVFIFFYGLEQRLVSGKNRGAIRTELHRLLGIYGENRSFRGYATRLLTFDAMHHLEKLEVQTLEKVFPLWAHGHPTDTQSLSAQLSWYALHKQPLPVELAFVVAERDPRTTNSVVTSRVREEVIALFAKRYTDRHGEGLKLTKGRRVSINYSPASSTLGYELGAIEHQGSLKMSFSDPLSNTKQFAPIAELLEACIDELRSYSRAVGNKVDEEMTPETWDKLPPELKAEVAHPHEERWLAVVRKYLNENGVVAAPAGKVAELCGITERDKLTLGQCRSIASVASGIGFVVEPDPQLLPQSWAWEDTISLVNIQHPAETPHPRYKVASLLAYLAMYIAGADGTVDDDEVAVIRKSINEFFDLQHFETRRLEALLTALSNTKITMRGVAERIDKHLSKGQRKQLAELLVAVAVADGVLDHNEKTYLKRAYSALELNPDEAVRKAEAMLEKDSPALSAPVTVRQASEESGNEAIPPRPKPEAPVDAPPTAIQLDAERISQIRRETREVADMLGKALSEGTDTTAEEPVIVVTEIAPTPVPQETAVASGPLGDLNARYQPFVRELITRNEWSEDDLAELARTHRLMLGAAISIINEWADQYLGEFLIRDAEPYEIRTHLLYKEISA